MTSNRCRRCGLINFSGTSACRRCDAPIAWAIKGATIQPEFSSQPGLTAGGGHAQQQHPARKSPSLSTDGETTVGSATPYVRSAKLRSGMAIRSLVLGIIGIVIFVLFLPGSLIAFLIGLVIGVRAVFNARRRPHIYGGTGVAIGGIVINSLGIIAVAFIAAIVIPHLMMTRLAANEARAIAQMRKLATAEAMYQSRRREGESGGTSLHIFGSMEELIAHGLIPAASTEVNGYHFKIRLLNLKSDVVPAGASDAVCFEVVATPDIYGLDGRRSFYTSEVFVTRWTDRRGKEATRSDPDLDHYIHDR